MSASAAFEAWRRNGQHFEFDGQRIFYAAHGDPGAGPALLCLHGFPTASWDWHAIWPALCGRFAQVLAPDLIGHGWSAKPPRHRYSIFDQADLAQALLRHRGVARYHLLAHDYGDSVAQELLARQCVARGAALPPPAYLDKADARALSARKHDSAPEILWLLLLNGGLFPETHRARPVQKLLLTPLGPLIAGVIDENAFAQSLSAVFGPRTQPGTMQMEEFWRLASHDGGHRIAHRVLRYIPERRANRTRWVGALQQAGIPLRLVDGALDPVSGQHMAERYRELVPGADVVLLEHVGHYPQLEDPAATGAAIGAFHDAVLAGAVRGD